MEQQGGTDSRIWVTRLIDSVQTRLGVGPLVSGTASLGMVPVVLTGLFFVLADGGIPNDFLIAHLLAMGVPVIGPAAIWYWDARVFPTFVEQSADLATDPTAVQRVGDKYKAIFSTRSWYFVVPWIALIVGLTVLNLGFFETVGVTGVGDPAFWVYLLFAAWWGLITGIGLHGAVTAVRTIRAVGELDLQIDPLHPDGLGGLSMIGHLAIWTTMLISLGSLALPLAFLLGTEGGYRAVVYLAVGVYIVVIAVSFAYPTVYVNRRAGEIQERELEKRREKIRQLQTQAANLEETDGETGTIDEVATRLEIQRLRDEFNEYDSVSLYPLSVGIIIRLVSSLLLPILFTLIDIYLGQLL
jgi:heme exporter protein D